MARLHVFHAGHARLDITVMFMRINAKFVPIVRCLICSRSSHVDVMQMPHVINKSM